MCRCTFPRVQRDPPAVARTARLSALGGRAANRRAPPHGPVAKGAVRLRVLSAAGVAQVPAAHALRARARGRRAATRRVRPAPPAPRVRASSTHATRGRAAAHSLSGCGWLREAISSDAPLRLLQSRAREYRRVCGSLASAGACTLFDLWAQLRLTALRLSKSNSPPQLSLNLNLHWLPAGGGALAAAARAAAACAPGVLPAGACALLLLPRGALPGALGGIRARAARESARWRDVREGPALRRVHRVLLRRDGRAAAARRPLASLAFTRAAARTPTSHFSH